MEENKKIVEKMRRKLRMVEIPALLFCFAVLQLIPIFSLILLLLYSSKNKVRMGFRKSLCFITRYSMENLRCSMLKIVQTEIICPRCSVEDFML